MPIPLICPSCNKKLSVPDEAVGKNVKCPHCGTLLFVPPPPSPHSQPAFSSPEKSLLRRIIVKLILWLFVFGLGVLGGVYLVTSKTMPPELVTGVENLVGSIEKLVASRSKQAEKESAQASPSQSVPQDTKKVNPVAPEQNPLTVAPSNPKLKEVPVAKQPASEQNPFIVSPKD